MQGDGKCTDSPWLYHTMMDWYLHIYWSSSGDHNGHFWGKSQLKIIGERSGTKQLLKL